ncbi:MAG: phosphomannomutase/phosphoglucomutase [Bryobacteraceae bacterium]|nr:phosphomannomutase/phosphoglucomutase [Bryobacteraceae bacterium]
MLKQSIFREYDIRAIADTELTDEGVRGLGQALGTHLQRAGARVVILGHDARLSGPRLRDALRDGVLASGCDTVDLGMVPTPVLYHYVTRSGFGAGVMITGSHNPPEYNGFKTMLGGGMLHGHAIQEVYRLLSEQDFTEGAGRASQADAVPAYVDEVSGQFQFDRRVKVVFDAGNGASGPTLSALLDRLNVDAIPMYFEPDGSFPNHHPDPTVEENLAPLKAKVRETGAELGIAFDGDGDRIGAVDEQGRVVWGDILTLIFGREILQRKPGATFIGEVKCSQLMYDELKRLGGNPIMFKTGHSLIKAKMKETKAELAGEMSGHMFFADRYLGYDDALYAACRLLEIVAASGRPLSAQTEDLPPMICTPELRVDCPDERKFGLVARIKRHFEERYETIGIDGVRVLFKHGWGLVRASNTQPVLVLRFEAATQEKLEQYRREVEAVVQKMLNE